MSLPDPLASLDFPVRIMCNVVHCKAVAAYIATIHYCEKRVPDPAGTIQTVCREHLNEWIAYDYPGMCKKCQHKFTGVLDLVWDVRIL